MSVRGGYVRAGRKVKTRVECEESRIEKHVTEERRIHDAGFPLNLPGKSCRR